MNAEFVKSRIYGCLLGGAVGDALGAPVEFVGTSDELARRFGSEGVRTYTEEGGIGRITDDTQMTLFTAEGFIRARVSLEEGASGDEVTAIDHAYARWLHTQGERSGRWKDDADGWLTGRRELHSRRAPGNACLSGLLSDRAGTIAEPINRNSKGCGGVMRVAPIGLVPGKGADDRFRLGAGAAALTHGHPSGYLAAGFLAAMIGALIDGKDRQAAVTIACEELLAWPEHEEVLTVVDAAAKRARESGLPSPEQIEAFGEGWVAEEALGIALWVALATDSFLDGVSAAVTHTGDSDSTGAIAGNILGAALGLEAIPAELIENLAEREIVEALADDVYTLLAGEVLPLTDEVRARYPGL